MIRPSKLILLLIFIPVLCFARGDYYKGASTVSVSCSQPSNTLIIGYNGGDTGTSGKATDDLVCSIYTAVDGCSVDTGYLKTTSGFNDPDKFRMCIYEYDDGDGGATSDLISNGQSGEVLGDGIAGDHSVTWGTPPSLVSSNIYGLCFHVSGDFAAYYDTDNPGSPAWYTITISSQDYASGCPSVADLSSGAQYNIWRMRAENP